MPESETQHDDTLSLERSAQLEREAFDRAVLTQSRGHLEAWLVRQGMEPGKAEALALRAWDATKIKRMKAAAPATQTHNGDTALAWLEILGGVALLIAGLAAGWFVGLFLVPIIDGFRRLGS